MINKILMIICFLAILLASSCSGNSNPIEIQSDENMSFTGQIYQTRNSSIWGAWKIAVDPEKMTAEIIPARNAHAIGNTFDSDLLQFLTVSPCANCLQITNMVVEFISEEPFGYFDLVSLEFTMTHPFDNITTRPDLHGFDVRLIFITPTDMNDYPDIQIIEPDGDNDPAIINYNFLLNADGYTSHYDWLTEDERYFLNVDNKPNNINPYLRFFDDPSDAAFDPHAPAGHNVIPVGSPTDTQLAAFSVNELRWASGEFYAIADVAYGQSATYHNRPDPQYYLPAFNRTEAWRVEYWIENNNLSEFDLASTADIVVQVFDWQHGYDVDAAYPNPDNLDGLAESSNVAQLELSIPGLQDAPIIVDTPESGTGSPDDPLQYRLTVTNENGSPWVSRGLLAVRDELHGSAAPNGRLPIPVQPAGFPYDTLDIRDYSLYETVRVNMPDSSIEFLYDGELLMTGREQFASNSSVDIFPYFFKDRSGKKCLYEWDWDYYGNPAEPFDVEFTGAYAEHHFGDGARVSAGLRVTDTTVPPREYVYVIPIYSEGTWWEDTGDSGGTDTTNFSGNHALYATETHYFIAYTSEAGAKRDIWLWVGDADTGTVVAENITADVPGDCYNPSITIVEDGPNEGVYLAFSVWEGGEPDLYSIYGDPVAGFDIANLSVISEEPETESNVTLIAIGDTLYSYYTRNFPGTGNDICVSSRAFSAPGWTYGGVVNDVTTSDQNFPKITYTEDTLYCAWHDGRDFVSRGHDIYMAESTNMVDFSDSVLVSNTIGPVEEAYPSITSYERQIGISWLAYNPIISETRAVVAMIDQETGSKLIHHVDLWGSSLDQTVPAISTSAVGKFTLAVGTYSSGSEALRIIILELTTDGGWTVDENLLESYDAGTVPLSGANVFPGIFTKSLADGTCVESFVAFRTFENNRTDSGLPFPMQFGDIQIVGIYSEGESGWN